MSTAQRIVVIDFHANAPAALAELPRIEGSAAEPAVNGSQARARVDSFAPRRALCELHIPRRGGLEPCKELLRVRRRSLATNQVARDDRRF